MEERAGIVVKPLPATMIFHIDIAHCLATPLQILLFANSLAKANERWFQVFMTLAIHMGDLDEILGSWNHSGPALAVTVI